MNIAGKWILWFGAIGLYAGVLGGIHYHRHFEQKFDTVLKSQMLDVVHRRAAIMIGGLVKRPHAITIEEYDVLKHAIEQDSRIASFVYLNRFGEVRWHRNTEFIGLRLDEFSLRTDLAPGVIGQAIETKKAVVRKLPSAAFYEIAIPFAVRGNIMGILDLTVSRKDVIARTASATFKYTLATVGCFLFIGVAGFLFLQLSVIAPLRSLRDRIEGVSLKGLDIVFPERNDEVGGLALSFSALLGTLRAERANVAVRDRQRGLSERRWWNTILTVILSGGDGAVVIDEDNIVLYSNLPVAEGSSNVDLHLLDLIDGSHQDILRAVAVAYERPNQVVESRCVLEGVSHLVKVTQLENEGELRRTLILFEREEVLELQVA